MSLFQLFRFSRRWGLVALSLGLLLGLSACSTAPPAGVAVVSPFDVKRYMGVWFEIARLDHRFERGLSQVSATYALQPDGSVSVTNRGYNAAKGAWSEAVGRAVFTGDSNTGSLKVSFFGPFYGGYHVIALDPDYRWAMVIGPDTGYLWILARDKTLPAEVRTRLVEQAARAGVDTRALIWVNQGGTGG
ncbi:MAG: lipocalin family protein [Hydrogenophaga sp.]|uniref:lipocalin family protein n=1 Tax=Hydrogenophaga sp. TaxID=1904254 RepID=UPI002723B204|nr:lipocalin family protein [Hydrogenophaga sp.]MDO9146393.1 lipocalin family protein [Hydrogenophaga sp.]MDO9605894.1 lipocalin family protein [Hydrogenophaga sp.]MDP2163087.1 lipocalin family protein [Hydrogenophaga sp.]MDP3476454.1 lipocalin family protein [Hydrogenophaga sp.]